MHALLHVALLVDTDTGIQVHTNSILGPTLILGDHPRTIDIGLPTHPESAAAFLYRLAAVATNLAHQITASDSTRP